MFDHITGNEFVKSYLRRVIEKESIGNSILFAGPEGIGKSLFAEAFARQIICKNDASGHHRCKLASGNHPDMHVYRPEGKLGMHSIAAMRQLSEEVYLAPFEAENKVFIIHDADRMLSYSANALLKTFEEPPLDTIIILLSSAPSSLLPTVLSRCRAIYFRSLSEQDIANFLMQHCQKNAKDAENIAMLSQGSIGNAMKLVKEGGDPLRAMVLHLLSQSSVSTYKKLSESTSAIAEQVEANKKEIEDAQASLIKGTRDHLSAAQRQSIEKEIEGMATMHAVQSAYSLFHIILGWYRDLHLMTVSGNPQYLIHRDCLHLYEASLNRKESLSLDLVQEAINETALALERSTSLPICLENLFLKLNFLK